MEDQPIERTVYAVWMTSRSDDMDRRLVCLFATASAANRFARLAQTTVKEWHYSTTDETLVEE